MSEGVREGENTRTSLQCIKKKCIVLCMSLIKDSLKSSTKKSTKHLQHHRHLYTSTPEPAAEKLAQRRRLGVHLMNR